MSCRTWLTGALFVLLLTAVGPSNLYADILNGNFEAGNVDFTSNYTYAAPNLGGLGSSAPMYAEGTYTVDDDPNDNHNLWASFGDHTTGTGLMLIANGATVLGLKVWESTPTPLAAGTYIFSAWVKSVYPANPAQLNFDVNGNLGSVVAGSDWTPFTQTFSTAGGSPTFNSIDVNIMANGNDFAIDDIHVAEFHGDPVPDGGATVMLLGGALVGIETLRRRLRF